MRGWFKRWRERNEYWTTDPALRAELDAIPHDELMTRMLTDPKSLRKYLGPRGLRERAEYLCVIEHNRGTQLGMSLAEQNAQIARRRGY
jgi:hypothetical protein